MDQYVFHFTVNHIYRLKGTIDSMRASSTQNLWKKSSRNEWGRLEQGNNSGVRHTETIDFIHQNEVPQGGDVTYVIFVLDHCPLITESNWVCITVGGNWLSYPNDSGSPAANFLEIKVRINSSISDAKHGAKFMTADIKVFLSNLNGSTGIYESPVQTHPGRH